MNLKTIILALCLVATAAVTAQAYRGGCPGQAHYQDFMSGLTPEQQEKVLAVTKEHHDALFALQKEIKATHDALEALFATAPTDKASVDKLVGEMNELQARKTKLNTDYRLELSEIAGKPVPLEPGKGCGYKAGCGATSSGVPGDAGTAPCCQAAPTT